MPIIDNELINEIRNSVNIVDIISKYIPLTKRGKNYFGVCPFHDDHSPSMSVSFEKQIYTCFSCGASGNVFTFISEYEHISFIEAVVLLGNQLGYKLDKVTRHDKNPREYKLYDLANKYFQNNLYSDLGVNALSYLEKRQLSLDVIRKFEIGLSISGNQLTNILLDKGYSLNELIDLGITNDNSSDFFQSRVIFPIWDLSGKVVAFSGRIYNTHNDSKYLNTKETLLFKKGHILYNYHRVREHLKKIDSIIIMEGFMDVIRASSVGIDNCVATLGTALTKDHISLISKITNNVILCFDGDKAGNEATINASKLLQADGIIPKIICLEEALDPDEYIIKYGKDKFLNHIAKPLSLIEFNMSRLKADKNLTDVKDIANYLDESINELIKVDDILLIELTLKKLAMEFNVNYDTLNDQYEKIKRINKGQVKLEIKPHCIKPKMDKYLIASVRLIYYMFKDNFVINLVEKQVAYFPQEIHRYLANEIINYKNTYGKVVLADFITHIRDLEDIYKEFNRIISLNLSDIYKEDEILDYIKVVNEYSAKRQIEKLTRELKEEKDPLKQAEISKKILEIRKVVLC